MARPKKVISEDEGLKLKVKRLHPDAKLPKKGTEESACYDLYALETVALHNLNANGRAYKIRTGLAFDIPKGYHLKVFLRSSIGLNTPLRLANQTGIIDSDFTGEVMLLVENLSRGIVSIYKHERIAQVLIEKNIEVTLEEVQDIPRKEHKGFGSTGKY